jgi:hypothetical protein
VYNTEVLTKELRTGTDGLLKTHADFPNMNLPKREQMNGAVLNQTLFSNFRIVAGKANCGSDPGLGRKEFRIQSAAQ